MKILVSQQPPAKAAAYDILREKYGATFDFRPFFLTEPMASREFREQRINLPDYTAVVFSSRVAIDAYFKLCEELRYKVPETMKYFCTTELVAMYLQKHIVYRKRKIFFGDGTPESIVAQIGSKHSTERFLITKSDNSNSDSITSLFDKASLEYGVAVMVKSVIQDIHDIDLRSYDAVVLYNPKDVKSLLENFPGFEQGDIKFITYGRSIVGAMQEAGLEISIQAPGPEVPSAAKAIELFLQKQA